jgi:archaetidylinositol phosphate synthase
VVGVTLDRYRNVATRLLDPLVGAAARVGLTPDGVSLIAFLLAVGAGVAFFLAGGALVVDGVVVPGGTEWYLVGSALVFLNGVLDLLDGQLARRLDVASRAGDLLDHVLDRYADIVVVAGLAAGLNRYALGLAAVTGVLMTSYLGTQAQAVGLDRVYGGLVGRADRLALVVVVTAVAPFLPGRFGPLPLTVVGWLLVFFALVGHLTAMQRFYHSLRALA